MKYVILIYRNPESQQVWESFTESEQAAGLRYYAGLTEELAESGELIVAERLADPATAKRITVRAGTATSTDGPFAEAKEQLAGFYLLECETPERAAELATRIPEAGFGLVELRPVMGLNGMEM